MAKNLLIRHLSVLLMTITLIGVGFIGFSTAVAQSTPSGDPSLVAAVEQAVTEIRGAPPAGGVLISIMTTQDDWVFGTIIIRESEHHPGVPVAFLFLARKSQVGWDVAIDYTDHFRSLIIQSPVGLVDQVLKDIVSGVRARGDGSLRLSLPWATNDTGWKLSGGPHNLNGYIYDEKNKVWNTNPARPWSAVDFGKENGEVRAAADGWAFSPCENLVNIRHVNNLSTSYYHLVSSPIPLDSPETQTKETPTAIKRGDLVGKTSAQTKCGGYANSPHVHFGITDVTSIKKFGDLQTIVGIDIGGWTVEEGSSPYEGCLVKDNVRRCKGETIDNDGNRSRGQLGTRNW